MQAIISGTTTERIIRTALLTLMFCGYCAWSLYDGYIAYPRTNVVLTFQAKMGIEPPDLLPAIDSRLTEQQALAVKGSASYDEVAASLGATPFAHGNERYFFGLGGHLKLTVEAGRVRNPQWTAGPKYTANDLLWQKIIGFVLAPLGLILVVQLVRVLSTRVCLTDEGLKVRGKPLIPFEAMTGFRTERYAKMGWLELDYSLATGGGSVRLDNYVVKEFHPIINAICERKDFPHPVPPSKDDSRKGESSAQSTDHPE